MSPTTLEVIPTKFHVTHKFDMIHINFNLNPNPIKIIILKFPVQSFRVQTYTHQPCLRPLFAVS